MKRFLLKFADLRFHLQESFVVLLPYLFLSSVLVLFNQFITIYDIDTPVISPLVISNVTGVVQNMFPLLLTMSLSYHLSAYYGLDRITGTGLATLTFLVNTSHFIGGHLLSLDAGAAEVSVGAVLAPAVAISVLSVLSRLRLPLIQEVSFSPSLTNAVNLLLPFVLAFLGSIILMRLVYAVTFFIAGLFGAGLAHSPDVIGMTVWLMVSHLLWFIGLHGTNLVALFLGEGFLRQEIVANLSWSAFIETFIGFGGVGSALGLAIAIHILSKDRHMRFVAMAGTPFAIFNITEVLIFGIPVIFNAGLLLPFLLAPLMNFAISYVAVTQGLFTFNSAAVPWTTPIGINAYLRTGGLEAPVFQVFLLALTALVYAPFVRRHSVSQSTTALRDLLIERLSFDEKLKSHHTRSFFQAQSYILRSHRETKVAIDKLSSNELTVFYQPKVDAHSGECAGFEALLRLVESDGSVKGPYILQTLEDAGFANIVDRWVCARVLKDFKAFSDQAPDLSISINLHPESLADSEFVDWLVASFKGKNADFEIVERGFCNLPLVTPNIEHIRAAGLHLSVDDFGAGFSNLSTLTVLPVDAVKLDKSLLDRTGDDNGQNLYATLTRLCKELGFEVVAEGVENGQQFERVKSFGVHQVQGWYFARALPREEAIAYARGLVPGV